MNWIVERSQQKLFCSANVSVGSTVARRLTCRSNKLPERRRTVQLLDNRGIGSINRLPVGFVANERAIRFLETPS